MSLLGAFIVPHPPLIIPQIGRGQETRVQQTIRSYQEIGRRIAELKPDTILLTSPHSVMYSDYLQISSGKHAQGDFGSFGYPEIKFKAEYDEEFIKELSKLAGKRNIPAGTLGERTYTQNGRIVSTKELDHGTMVPLYFINQFHTDCRLVRLSISGLSPLTHYRFGQCIADLVFNSEKRYVFVASGDLSHKLKADGPYGYAREGEQFDSEITQAMETGDFMRFLTFEESFCEEAAECGLRSFQIMAGALDGKAVRPELLSYEGPFGVGYGIAAFQVNGEDASRRFGELYTGNQRKELSEIKEKEDDYVKLARQSLEYYIKNRRRMKRPEGLPPELLNKQAGVFVSLKKEGRLRGCIGTILPTTGCIADEIIQNAVSAGVQDQRFEPVTKEELPWLVYDVDVLGKSEPIQSMKELDVKRYGVIVSCKGRRGLLLPNLEGVTTPAQQVGIALRKADISEKEPYTMERFEVVRHL